jgi:hypothetical protein
MANQTSLAGSGPSTIGGTGVVSVGTPQWLMLFGDSTVFAPTVTTWPTPLQRQAEISGGGVWDLYNVGLGGSTVASGLAALTTTLAGMPPALYASDVRVLINYGVNDMAAMPSAGTWQANYLAMIDAIHAKWPTARIYLMRPWFRTHDADSDTLAGWIATIIAARATFVFPGPDERIWLKGSDDGATMTVDGAHYSAAGNVEAVNQWKAILWP